MLGAEAGFEIYCDDPGELTTEFAELAEGRDYCIAFIWGGSMVEGAAVLIASFALAKKFNAVVSYDGEEPAAELELLLEETQAAIEEAREEI